MGSVGRGQVRKANSTRPIQRRAGQVPASARRSVDVLSVQAFDAYEMEKLAVPRAAGSDFVLVNLLREPARSFVTSPGLWPRPGLELRVLSCWWPSRWCLARRR